MGRRASALRSSRPVECLGRLPGSGHGNLSRFGRVGWKADSPIAGNDGRKPDTTFAIDWPGGCRLFLIMCLMKSCRTRLGRRSQPLLNSDEVADPSRFYAWLPCMKVLTFCH